MEWNGQDQVKVKVKVKGKFKIKGSIKASIKLKIFRSQGKDGRQRDHMIKANAKLIIQIKIKMNIKV